MLPLTVHRDERSAFITKLSFLGRTQHWGIYVDGDLTGDWQAGDDVIISPALSDDDAKDLFPEGWNELTPYLRMVKQPK